MVSFSASRIWRECLDGNRSSARTALRSSRYLARSALEKNEGKLDFLKINRVVTTFRVGITMVMVHKTRLFITHLIELHI
jgi:hypothetical protein